MTLRGLIDAGLLTPPLELERSYKGEHFTARVEADGRVSFRGASYHSLSTAAAAARSAALGASSYVTTNGWVFWEFRDERGKLVPMDVLRRRA